MMRKLLLLFFTIISLFVFVSDAKSQVKINAVLFDNSSSGIFLLTDTVDNQNNKLKITPVKLNNNKIYFDIEGAILSHPAKLWELQNDDIEKIQLAQFKTKPDIVRIVFYHNSNFDPDYIRVLRTGNVITFRYNKSNFSSSYYSDIYREENSNTSNFREKLTISEVTEQKIEPVQAVKKSTDKEIAGIEQAVGGIKQEVEIKKTYKRYPLKMRTKYFINQLNVRGGNILVYGIGKIEIKKPILLTNPSRIVYDFPNTILDEKIKGKEQILSENETVKIAQFDSTKVRLVITTPHPEKYRIIYSSNMQSILISNDEKIQGLKLFNSLAKIKKLKMTTLNDNTDILTMSFDNPLIHSVKNTGDSIEIILYNTDGITPQMLAEVFNVSRIQSIKANRFSENGYRIIIPAKDVTKVEETASADGKNFNITIKTPIEVINSVKNTVTQTIQTVQEKIAPLKKTYTVVIDSGHGGADVGATRNGIYEKDINIKVSKKVADMLTQKGINVEMTHWHDETQSLQARVEFAEAKKADLFVSVHTNASSKPEIHGVETHYYHEHSKELATHVQKHLAQRTGAHNRGILKSKFYVINHTTMPAILVEIGFISNNNERSSLLLEKRQTQTAEAIVEGITEILDKR